MVNAIVWFNLLWLHRESIVAELWAMQPNPQVAVAIRWMEQGLPKADFQRLGTALLANYLKHALGEREFEEMPCVTWLVSDIVS